MRRVLLLLAVSAISPAGAFATAPWTLGDAIQSALSNSPDAVAARHRITGARAVVQQTRAMGMPQVTLQGRYTQTDSPMMAFGSILNQRAFTSSIDFNNPGTIDNLNLTGTVALNLYSGGRASAGIAAARHASTASEFDERAVLNQLGAEVVKAYLDIDKAAEAILAVEAGVRAYEAAVSTAQARFEAGQMLKADLLSLEVQLAQTREALIVAQHNHALAGCAFLFLLGIEPTAESVEIANDDPSVAAIAMPADFNYAQRPELLGLEARVQAAESMVRVARGARRPTINAFASYGYDHGWKLDEGADNWMAGVSVDLSIFDGGSISGKVRKSEAELAEVREMYRKAALGISLEVEQARLAHEQARQRLEVATRAVAQAGESASLSRARFEEGALLIADLIGVEGRLIEARMRRTVAEADERIALADLRRALGLPPLERPGES